LAQYSPNLPEQVTKICSILAKFAGASHKKMANFWRVFEFDKFAGEWPLLNFNPFFGFSELKLQNLTFAALFLA
jgi:hypothetical protein